MKAERSPFGTLADGTVVEAVTLANRHGVIARIITYGATLQALHAPDRHGARADILLGYDDLEGFVDRPNYFGVTVGRYANRVAGGTFRLDGKEHQLTLNEANNSLHGGTCGFDKRVWRIARVEQGPVASVALTLLSPDGDQGYPGTLEATVTYSLDEENRLTIDFRAETDAPTIVNMTNHAVFNLAGAGGPAILDHRLTVPASAYTPVDARLVPTGELRPVDGTAFDFRAGRTIGDGIRDGTDPQIVAGRGYDHNFVLDTGSTAEPKHVARLEDPKSGRVLDVSSTEPGVQIYTGNFLDGTLVGKGGRLYRQGDGIAIEPQKFPDSPNRPGFASARVDPGRPYRHRMVFGLSVAR